MLPQATVNWLRQVATSYSYPDRLFADVQQALVSNPGFVPRHDMTLDDIQQILLSLNGTLPIAYRGATYNIPLVIWLPKGYPHNAPIVSLKPTPEMLIRPSSHVDVVGRIYHPFLAYWHQRPQV